MRLRKEPSILIALVGLFLFEQTARVHAQKAPAKETKHCLWQVQGKTNTMYLLGSMHFLKKEVYPLAQPIEDAYRNSQIVFFEMDLAEIQAPAGAAKFLAAGRYPPGETLQENISPQTYASLGKYLTEAVGSPNAFDSFKPWMAAVGLMEIELQRLGFDPQQGIDMYFFKKAKQDRKEIRGLETIDFQLGLFTGLAKEDQDAMLKETIEDIAASKAILAEFTEAWQTGDIKRMDKFLLETMRQYPQIHKKLLLDRNKNWVGALEKQFASTKNVLVVVGAAHLIGKDSVVDLLSKKGYKVEQK